MNWNKTLETCYTTFNIPSQIQGQIFSLKKYKNENIEGSKAQLIRHTNCSSGYALCSTNVVNNYKWHAFIVLKFDSKQVYNLFGVE